MTLIAIFILVNLVLTLTVLTLTLRAWRKEPSPRVRPLWLLLALVMVALAFGGTHRLALQATRIGWLNELAQDILLTQWQLVQSLLVGSLIVFAYVMVRRSTTSMRDVERIAGTLMERVSDVHLDLKVLTPRERDVLAALEMGKLTDRELADHLVISQSTVQSHVKALLRKTGLHRRQDLVAVALLSDRTATWAVPLQGGGRSPTMGGQIPQAGNRPNQAWLGTVSA